MARLSDEIESFILAMLTENGLELRRNELAAQFGCAPSQINYVLSTRFTVDHGYVIESRRGGGGYIRIVRIVPDDRTRHLSDLYCRIGQEISREDTMAILRRLGDQDILTRDEAILLFAAMDSRGLKEPEEAKRKFRAHSMKNVINMLLEGQTSREGETT